MSKSKSAFARATQEERAESYFAAGGDKTLSYVDPTKCRAPVKIYKAKEGVNAIRIVPHLAGDEGVGLLGLEVRIYYLSGESVLSPRTLNRHREDPATEAFFKYRNDGDPQLEKLFQSRRRLLMWVIDYDAKTPELCMFECPATLAQDIKEQARSRDGTTVIPLEDPEEGRCLEFVRRGERLQTRYGSVKIDAEPTPLADGLEDEMSLLNDILIIPTPDEMQAKVDHALRTVVGDDEQPFGPSPYETQVHHVGRGGGGTPAPRGGVTPAPRVPPRGGTADVREPDVVQVLNDAAERQAHSEANIPDETDSMAKARAIIRKKRRQRQH